MAPLRASAFFIALAATSCAPEPGDREPGDGAGTTSTPTECPDGTWVTWENFAEPLIQRWCTPCHASTVPLEQRQGAPLGIDFDTYDDVALWSGSIAAVTSADDPQMPPAGGPKDEERDLLADWIRCGMPVPPDPVPPGACDALTYVEGDSDGVGLCALGNALRGDLTLAGSPDLSCLCQVDGDVSLTAGSASAPVLTRIGGDLTAVGGTALSLPALVEVGGSVALTGADGLAVVDLSELATLGGDFTASDLAMLETLHLPRLLAAPGDFKLDANASLASIDLSRLASVGGSLVWSELPSLVEILNAHAIDTVGGDVILTGLSAVGSIDLFARLYSVDGTVSVFANPGLTLLEGFDDLHVVGGDLRVTDNPDLRTIAAFGDLESVAGAFRIAHDLRLETISPVPLLATVGSFELQELPSLLTLQGFDGLTATTGDFVLSDVDSLNGIGDFKLLTGVGGTLSIEGDDSLVDLHGLSSVSTVGGDLIVMDNPVLPSAVIDGLVASIGAGDVGGDVVVSGNGP